MRERFHSRGRAFGINQSRYALLFREPRKFWRRFRQEPPRPAGRDHASWIPERSATRLRKADLNVLSKLGNQGLEWRLEPEAFTGGEVRREDDLLDVLVGCAVDIEVAGQPST